MFNQPRAYVSGGQYFEPPTWSIQYLPDKTSTESAVQHDQHSLGRWHWRLIGVSKLHPSTTFLISMGQVVSQRTWTIASWNARNILLAQTRLCLSTNRMYRVIYSKISHIEKIVYNYKENKEDPNCTRLTVGSKRINYPGDCGTITADLITTKIIFNVVL